MKQGLKPILNYCKAAKMELIVVAAALFADLLSKYLISHFLRLGQTVALIDNFLYFHYTKNPAASFSFDFGLTQHIGESGVRIFFIVLMTVATAVFALLLVRGNKNHLLYRLSFALIIGGAIGNLYDRIFHHAVRDFISIKYFGLEIFGSQYFAIFNIADSSLVVGVCIFILYFLLYYSKDERAKEQRAKQLQTEKIEQETAEGGENV